MTWLSADLERVELAAQRVQEAYFADRPVIAEINRIAASLIEIVGPMLWAVLILMCVWAELYLD